MRNLNAQLLKHSLIRIIIALLITYFFSSHCLSQEVPKVVSYSPADYAALNQNWSITEGCDMKIYVANTEGVLIFNGYKWRLVSLPENRRPRSLHRGVDCRIYVSGYETFGYLDLENPAEPAYISIADGMLADTDQEFWRVFGDSSQVIFQSFSEVYSYNYKEVVRLPSPGNIMLGSEMNGELILPKIESGIYKIRRGVILEEEVERNLPAGSKVVGVTPDSIYATQDHGLFKMTSRGFIPFSSALNDLLMENQINVFIKTSAEQYVVGTILNGIYVSDDLETAVYHIDKSNGLSNNTVLSIKEDSKGNIWAALDKGIDLIKLSSPLRYYFDVQGQLGSIFTSIFYNGNLYIGSNHGVFKRNKEGRFSLIPGSQGQVWSFLIVDGDLLCGHNRGTYLVHEDEFTQVSSITGGWSMRKVSELSFIQSSYTGLILFEKKGNKWDEGLRLNGDRILLENFQIVDSTLIGFHPHHGLSQLELSDNYSSILEKQVIRREVGSEPLISTTATGFMVQSDKDSITIPYNMPVMDVDTFAERYGRLIEAISNSEQISNVRFTMPSIPHTSVILACNDGYISVPNNYSEVAQTSAQIDYVLVNGSIRQDLHLPDFSLDANENDITFQFRNELKINKKAGLNYKLQGWEESWFPLPQDGELIFNNLQYGEYSLLLSSGEKFNFEIQPYWYESWPGMILYATLIILTVFFFNRRQELKLRLQKKKLDDERLKEVESERIKAKNTELENEVTFKNKMLANSTMTLVQKNKMLIDLKTTLSKELTSTNSHKRSQILHLIELNINSEDDWELFESTFAEVHEDYLEKLKEKHPSVTQGELRLAAYIKMDLSSKEIAPLMNISVRSIENKRYRLRKKFALEHQSLKTYLQSF